MTTTEPAPPPEAMTSATQAMQPMGRSHTERDPAAIMHRLTQTPGRAERLTHVEKVPAREASTRSWPDWVHPDVRDALGRHGVTELWSHQVAAAEHAHAGRHVALATGTASGKTLGYLLPALPALAEAAS